jgi:hypothetical protein
MFGKLKWAIRIGDLVSGGRVRNRGMVIQQKTKRPVQFELLERARSIELSRKAARLAADSLETGRERTVPSRSFCDP